MTTLELVLSILGTVIALYAGSTYIWSVVRGPTRPHRVTWGGWALAGILGLLASHEGGAGIGLMVAVAFVAIVSVTFGLSLLSKYGKPGGEKSDYIAGALAAVDLIAWAAFDLPPTVAAAIAVVADAVFLWFTLREAWLQPETEALHPWIYGTIAEVLGVITLGEYSFAAAAYPVYILVGNVLIVSALLIRQPRKKSKHQKQSELIERAP